jgi:tetratricopeptide (TPR) repeat protein
MTPETHDIIVKLIQDYPRDYTEMHAKKAQWDELRSKLSKTHEYIKLLLAENDELSLMLLGKLAHNVGVFTTHVIVDYPEAQRLLTMALSTKQSINAPSESIALTHAHLADCAYRNGNSILGIQHFELACQAYQQSKGTREIDLEHAFVLHASGNAYYNIGAYAKALDVFIQARTLRLKHLSQDDLEFAHLEHDHANVLVALGEHQAADELFTSALQKKKKYFENGHTNIALLYQCRALLYIKNSQLSEAKTNLDWAYTIYSKHVEHSVSKVQPDLLRNYFYSILLYLAAGNVIQATAEMEHFKFQIDSIEDKTHSVYVRFAQLKTRIYQSQNQPEAVLKQLEETIEPFVPKLNFNKARDLLTPDNKFDVAPLLGQYAIELLVQKGYQKFDECLQILTIARQLKQDFYSSLPDATPPLGTVNEAFSDYDFGLLYYLGALATDNPSDRQQKLVVATQYIQEAQNKLLKAGLAKEHINVLACTTQLNHINDLLNSSKQESNNTQLVFPNRSMFFPSLEKMKQAEGKLAPYLDTMIRAYP